MPIPTGYVKYVITGTLRGGEIFETGFWSDLPAGSQAELQDAVDTEADNVESDFGGTGPRVLLDPGSAYTSVRAYAYNGGNTAEFVATSAVTGTPGTGNTTGIDKMCCVATLLTGAAGRRARGRMYLPASGASLTNGQFTSGPLSDVATALQTHFDRFDGHAVVLSQVAGTARPITAVRIDSLVDIQRRRGNALVAATTVTRNLT